MRLRNIPGAKETVANSGCVVQEPQTRKGRWKEVFHRENPIHIEVGMGKGQFLMKMAAKNPQINYLGMEMYDSVLLRALQLRENWRQSRIIFFLSGKMPVSCRRSLNRAKLKKFI